MKKAIPYYSIVRQFAFLNDLPFVFLKDQMAVIKLYEAVINNNL